MTSINSTKACWNWDSTKCVLCKRCLIACPNYSLRLKSDGSIHNNTATCTLCGACAKVCNLDAISFGNTNP